MEDIIDIIVTETTNTIEITSQASDELIDVNIIDNREDITLNVTPTLVEININSLTGNFGVEWGDITGTLADQTDLNTALGLKADLVGGKVPSSQLPSYVDDIVEVATYSALPATGETGKIYVVLDTNKIYRWSGSAYIEIADSTAVWGAITGTLSSQTDLQSALNAKFDDPTGDTTQYIAGDGSLITFPVAGQAGTLVREVRNTTGATLTKGTVVYISGATGNKPTVSKAIATGDSTSAQTFGMCQANISNNSNGYVVCVGDITGLDTSALSEGVQLYLSSTTAGTYTTTKQLAPAHLVYIGVVTRSHPTQGQIEVKIQNGYELDEIHDVAISSVANNDGIFYESSTSLWKNKSIATVLGYTPQAQLNGTGFVKISGTTISYDNTAYLPLAGGTLTGALFGASASFSGFVGFGGNTSPLAAIDVTGAGKFSSSITASALYVTGMTAGSGAIYHTGSRLTFANYNASGTLHFEVNGGVGALTIAADGSATFENYISTTKLGVGVGTPATLLEVKSTTTNLARIRVSSTTSTAGNYRGYEFSNGSTFRGGLVQDESTEAISLFTPIGGQSLIVSSDGKAQFMNSVFAGGADTNAFASTGRNVLVVNGSSQSLIGMTVGGVNKAYLYHEGTQLIIQNIANGYISFGTNDSEKVRLTNGGKLLVGTTSEAGDAKLVVSGRTYTEGVYIATGQFSQGGGTTSTFYTFSNISSNRAFLVTLRQSGSAGNTVTGMAFTYGGGLQAYNLAQDNTNPVLYLTLSASGLELRLTTGAGYGTTTWDWTITQIK